jgi:hypothetical protein
MWLFLSSFFSGDSRSEGSEKVFWLCERAFARGYPAERGSGGAFAKTPNGLSASATLPPADKQCQCYFCESLPPIRETQSAFHPHAHRNACSRRCDCGQHCSLNKWIQTALSNSQKRSEFLISSHNERPSIVTVRVCNPDCPPLTIDGRNAAPTPTGFAEIVSDDFPVLQCQRCLVIVHDRLRCGFAQFKLCAHFLDLRRLFL